MNIPSVMTHSFSRVPKADIPRSSFDRSHGYKTTFDAGYLVPIYVDEALPGDTFSARMSVVARLNTPLRPLMDNASMSFFFFAVPYRLVWNNWHKFNGEQENPGDSTDFVVPTMTSTAGTGYLVGSLHDYLSLPVGVPGLPHSSLFHRAYNLIWNDWFRDENLQDRVVVDKDDGPDNPADYVLLRRGKRHDYFTSCLPWPQKGDAVELPLGTSAPVVSTASQVWMNNNIQDFALRSVATQSQVDLGFGAGNTAALEFGKMADGSFTGLQTDLTAATAATINQLRQAFQVQKLYERDARGGTRLTEVIRSHFGVTSPDQRLQRPEYLGGGSLPVVVSSGSASNPSSTVVNLGFGNTSSQGAWPSQAGVSGTGIGFTKSFTEHCILIGLACVHADLTYASSLNRMFSRSTRWDFYWPALSSIGEQAVLNKEIWPVGTAVPGQDDLVFGYQERYAEYRYKPSVITGSFNQYSLVNLAIWHLSQQFSALPVLNSEFIVENPPFDRVVAVPSEAHFAFDSYMQLKCARPMPVYGVPGMIDHF